MSEITVIGIDLAKKTFSICGMNEKGKVLLRKTLDREAMHGLIVNSSKVIMAFEACGGSHHWARICQRYGHQVKMIAPHRVKPFSPEKKKNDQVDAEAIAVAALQPSVPSVAAKSTDQQDLDVLQNYRDQLIAQRVAHTNQIHAICLEYGVTLPSAKSCKQIGKILEELEDASNELTEAARGIVYKLLTDIEELLKKEKTVDKELSSRFKENTNFKLLCSIPGVGLQTATAIMAYTGGNVSSFKNGRQFAACLGLTPRQHSTGGRTKLLGLTKAGNARIRRLLIMGMHAVLRMAEKRQDPMSKWAASLRKTKPYRIAAVALANKAARIAFAVLANQTAYAS